jgi:hypothetical protein
MLLARAVARPCDVAPRLVAVTRNEEFEVSNEVDAVPDNGEASVRRAIDGPDHAAPAAAPPDGTATTSAVPPAKRRLRMVVLIVVGLLVVVGSWWATSALLGLLNPAGTSEEGGYTYSSSEAGYEITFPGAPALTTSAIPFGDLDIEQTTATWSNGSTVYGVTTAELPADLVASGGNGILEDLLYGLRASTPGEELREKTERSLDGERALSGMIAGDGSDTWYTVAMHGNTEVILTLVVPTGESAPAFAETFRFID